jgi:hypothetical protein
MRAAARYLKGCEMLERHEGKLSRTVLRRGGASNRFPLSLHKIVFRDKDFISYKTIILYDIIIDSLYGGLDN